MHQKQCNPFLCEHYIYRYIKGELHFIRLLARPLVGAQGRRGLSAYVAHAKELLAESAADKNPFEGYAVEVHEGDYP